MVIGKMLGFGTSPKKQAAPEQAPVDPVDVDLHEVENVDKKTVAHIQEHGAVARTVGFKSVIGMNLASMLGSCLILPGPSADFTGSSAWLAIIVSGIAVLPACYSKAELGTAMPHSGGAYIYLARSFGPLIGAIVGVGLWLDLMFQAIFGLRGSTEYINVLMGQTEEWVLRVIGVVLLLFVLGLNLSGIKWVKTVTKWFTIFIMLFLLGIGFSATASDDASTDLYKSDFVTNGAIGFLQAVGFVHMGYGGLTKICAIASEVKNPEFNLPYGMLVSLFIMVAWFAFQTSVMSMVSDDITELGEDYSPFYTMGSAVAEEVLGKFCAALCVIGMASMGNVSLLAVSRFPFAMARDGLIPTQFEYVWHSTGAPWFSLCTCSVVIGLCIVTLPIKSIIKLASSFKILMFMAQNICVFVFRRYAPEWYKPAYYSPLYPWMQIFGTIFGIVLLTMMDIEGLIATLVICAIGALLYMVYGRYHGKFMGLVRIEEYFGIVPEAYLAHQKYIEEKLGEKELSLLTEDSTEVLVEAMINDPQFLADWRKWTHEEILFWFAHTHDGKFVHYNKKLADTVPQMLRTGADLIGVNDLVLRILGIDDKDDRVDILNYLAELEMIERPEELIAYGATDTISMEQVENWKRRHVNEIFGDDHSGPTLKIPNGNQRHSCPI